MSQDCQKKDASHENGTDHSNMKIRDGERTIEPNPVHQALHNEINANTLMGKVMEAEHKRFNDLLETLPVYLILMTPDYHVPFANRFFRERFGESNGQRCFEYLFGRNEPCEICETYTTLKSMKPHRWEWLGPDGRWYDIYDMPFTDTDGSTLILEMGVDITERKQSEEEIRRYQEKLEEMVRDRTAELERKNEQLALDIAALQKAEDDIRSAALFPRENPFPVMRVSIDGKLLYANSASAELLEEWQSHVGAPIPATIKRTLAVAIANGTRQKMEIRCGMHDYSLILAPITERGYVNFYGHDITEHKKTEDALLKSRERYKELVTNANSIIIRMDQSGTITYFNEYAQRFFGYALDEILGKDVKILVPRVESNGKDMSELVDNILRNPDSFEENINENVRRNGERVWVSWRNKAIRDSDGSITGNLAIGNDVTERLRAEDALRESESVLHSFFDSGGAMRGIVEVIAEDDVLHITDNAEAASFAGLTHEAMKNKRGSELGESSDILRMWINRYNESKLSGKPVTFEHSSKRGDIEVWIRATVNYLGTPPHGYPRFSYVSFEITEQKRMENELRETRDYLDRLIKYANAPIIVWEPSLKITRFNRAFEFLTGYKSYEVIGLDLEILFPETSREDSLSQISHTLGGKHWESVEIPILRKDGEVRIALWNSANIYSEDGTAIVATIAQGQDITKLKQTQEALYRSESNFKLLSETAERLIMWKNIQPIVNDLCQRTMAHLGCHVFFNYLVDENVGRLHLNAFAGISDEDAGKIKWLDYGSAVCGCAACDGKPIVAENIFTTPDIRTDLVKSCGIQAYACHPLVVQGKVIGTLSFGTRTRTSFSQEELSLMMKVTAQVASAMERARLINEVQQSRDELELRVKERTTDLEKTVEALRRSNMALEDFAHVASHDLQEPLRKIMTFSERLATIKHASLSDQTRDYLERMHRAANRMHLLIQDLAKYSRITSSSEHFKVMNLRESVEDAVKDLSILIEETGAKIEISELPDIKANRIQMSQLFVNLINNALKYRSKLKPLIRIYSSQPSGDLFNEVYIEDNGIGFDEMYLDRIFKPFQRLHGKNSPYQGTGMGLAICSKIVENHGGGITARSEPGKGSSFIVRLPKVHEAQAMK